MRLLHNDMGNTRSYTPLFAGDLKQFVDKAKPRSYLHQRRFTFSQLLKIFRQKNQRLSLTFASAGDPRKRLNTASPSSSSLASEKKEEWQKKRRREFLLPFPLLEFQSPDITPPNAGHFYKLSIRGRLSPPPFPAEEEIAGALLLDEEEEEAYLLLAITACRAQRGGGGFLLAQSRG